MTFSDWYAANVEPTLPSDCPPQLRTAAREQMARCWNAALSYYKSYLLLQCCTSPTPGQEPNIAKTALVVVLHDTEDHMRAE